MASGDQHHPATNGTHETKISAYDKAVLNRIFNPNLPYGDVVDEEEEKPAEEEELETEVVKEAKRLEIEGVKAAEGGNIDSSLDYFNQSVQVAPERPSGYNNRAQALRLKGNVQGALEDLNKAIGLSGGKGQAACQAYTQRALIKRLEEKEESALEDFKQAAALGSEFAKQMCIALNPYAALCNEMMCEMMTKIRKGDPDV